jgi:hypothetical protein
MTTCIFSKNILLLLEIQYKTKKEHLISRRNLHNKNNLNSNFLRFIWWNFGLNEANFLDGSMGMDF